MPKKRFTEEERKQRLREAVKRYRLAHPLLCMNCNWAMGLRGYCPHQQVGGATFAIGVAA